MKQTKISVEIHKHGDENEYLLKLVANVNSRGYEISSQAIGYYLLVKNAIHPEYKNLFFTFEGEDTLHISEDGGKTFTLTLTWKEVETLDDLPQDIFTSTKEEATN